MPFGYTQFSDWLRDHPEPSLQALVEQHGTYEQISEDAWRAFFAARKQWELDRQQWPWTAGPPQADVTVPQV